MLTMLSLTPMALLTVGWRCLIFGGGVRSASSVERIMSLELLARQRFRGTFERQHVQFVILVLFSNLKAIYPVLRCLYSFHIKCETFDVVRLVGSVEPFLMMGCALLQRGETLLVGCRLRLTKRLDIKFLYFRRLESLIIEARLGVIHIHRCARITCTIKANRQPPSLANVIFNTAGPLRVRSEFVEGCKLVLALRLLALLLRTYLTSVDGDVTARAFVK